MGFYEPESTSIAGVVYYSFDKDFNLLLRIDARRARFLEDRWVFVSGLYQELMPGGGYQAELFDEKDVDLPERPQDFSRLAKPSEEMSLVELAAWLDKLEKEGYDSRRYRWTSRARFLPLVCLLMACGVPLPSSRKGPCPGPRVVLVGRALCYW